MAEAKAMSEEELLEHVKTMLGISGTYQDNTLKAYIAEIKEYLLGAGVVQDIVDSTASAGVITRGVSDLWNYGSGNATLSPYFYQRATQLVLRVGGVSK